MFSRQRVRNILFESIKYCLSFSQNMLNVKLHSIFRFSQTTLPAILQSGEDSFWTLTRRTLWRSGGSKNHIPGLRDSTANQIRSLLGHLIYLQCRI